MKKRWLIIGGVAAFLAASVYLAPAAVLIGWALPDNAAVKLSGVSGSLGRGRIEQIQQQGKVLGPVRWAMKPLGLLLLRPSFDVWIEQPLLGRGVISVSPLGTVRLSDWQATAAIADLAAVAGYAFLPIGGNLGLQLGRLQGKGQLLEEISGQAQLLGLNWTLGKQNLDLGEVIADLSTDEDGVHTATLSSPRGPLDLNGSARLDTEQRYDVDIKLKPKADASQQLVNLMRGLGRPDTQGYYSLRYRGQLPGNSAP